MEKTIKAYVYLIIGLFMIVSFLGVFFFYMYIEIGIKQMLIIIGIVSGLTSFMAVAVFLIAKGMLLLSKNK